MGMNLQWEPARCPCGSRKRRQIYRASDIFYGVTERIFSVVECLNCRLVYLNPRPRKEFIPQLYPKAYFWNRAIEDAGAGSKPAPTWEKRLSAWYFRRLSERRAVWASELLSFRRKPESRMAGLDPGLRRDDGHVLDIGCGLGGFVNAMKRRGYRARGIQGDFERADFGKDKFNLISFWHVLEHLPDPAEALRKTAGLLKPGGWVIIGTQNFDSVSRRLMGPTWPLNDIPRHFFHFTRNTLGALLLENGFSISREWRRTESFPVFGAHLISRFLLRRDFSLRIYPALLASLALAPIEYLFAQNGLGCLMTVAARRI